MTVRYLNFQIQNITGGCYDWFVTLGKEVITGKLDEVKAKAMAYACKQARRNPPKHKNTDCCATALSWGIFLRHLRKTGAGIGTPDNVKGDTDAESVFFCVMPSHSHT